MMTIEDEWYKNCNWYHIYPLGLCGVSRYNSDHVKTENKIEELFSTEWLEHLKSLSIGAVYIGPIFESFSHGYDTIDLFSIDKRLGNTNSFRKLVRTYHSYGIKVIVDAVFNHVGRNFFAFNDIKNNGKNSRYCKWFKNLDFTQNSPKGDNFTYKPWQNYYELVTLNIENQEVKNYLYDAVKFWYDEFEIDGLRLDAADCIAIEFWRDFRKFCKEKFGKNFVLIAEIIHGDGKLWARPSFLKQKYQNTDQPFDGITNCPLWKAIWSSHNTKNLYELVHTISHQSDILSGSWLYNFVDNHDVTRIASQVEKEEYLGTIFIILFTIQGSPSIYYGSEFKFKGVKGSGEQADFALRPELSLQDLKEYTLDNQNGLLYLLRFLSFIRKHHIFAQILTVGEYIYIENNSTFFIFKREFEDQFLLIAINIDSSDIKNHEINWNGPDGNWRDLLHPENAFQSKNGKMNVSVPANWAIMVSSFTIELNYKKFAINRNTNYFNFIPIFEACDSDYTDAFSNDLSDNNQTEAKFFTPKMCFSLNSTSEKLDYVDEIETMEKKYICDFLETENIIEKNAIQEWFINKSILYISINKLVASSLISDKFVKYIVDHKFRIIAISYLELEINLSIENEILKFVELVKSNENKDFKIILHSNKLIGKEIFDGYITNQELDNEEIQFLRTNNKIFISENLGNINSYVDASINCELQKALWSCFADENMFEIGHNLQRQFDEEYGIFKQKLLINTSSLKISIQKRIENFQQLLLYFIIIFTIPGIPIVLLEEEIQVEATENEKKYLGNFLTNIDNQLKLENNCEIQRFILSKLIEIREQNSLVFTQGLFKICNLTQSEIVYSRYLKGNELILICINSSKSKKKIFINKLPKQCNSIFYLLKTINNQNFDTKLENSCLKVELPELSGLILKLK